MAYWARRVGFLLLFLVGLAGYVAIIYGVVRAAGPPGSPGFLAVLTAESVFSLVTCVLVIRHSWRRGISGEIIRSGPTQSRSRRQNRATGAGLGLLAASAGPVGAFLLVAGSLLSAGFMLAVTALWLVPVLPIEQYARRQLSETLQLAQQAHPQGHMHDHHPRHGDRQGGQSH